MEIEYISEFVVLAETCSYAKAANSLYISQSSLSKHIQRLEEQLGVSLLNRTTRHVELNEYGHLFLPYAKTIADTQVSYIAAINACRARIENSVSIASLPVMDLYQITQVISGFKNRFPKTNIKVIEAYETDPLEMLKSNACEFAFIREHQVPQDEFTRIRYTDDSLVAILPAEHRLASKSPIPLDTFRNDEFLLSHSSTRLYSYCIDACQSAGFAPKVIFSGHRLENIIQLVEAGMGISLLMRKQAEYLSNSKVVIADVLPSYHTSIFLCYKKKEPLSPGGKQFLSYFTEFMDATSGQKSMRHSSGNTEILPSL